MRKSNFIILLLVILSALQLCYVAAASARTLTVGSYNIRYSNRHDSIRGDGWQQRCPRLCAQLRWERPDIFGAQEVLHSQLQDMLTALPGYKYIGVGRDDGAQAGEYAAIFYDTLRIELLDEGHFWLNETPDRPAKGWDAACVRICTWGHFRDCESGIDFYFLNLHMDHVGVVARREAAKLVMQRITLMTDAGSHPAVLTGDFNVPQTDELYALFTQSGVLKDCYTSAADRFAENGTYNSFSSQSHTSERIDHIFVTPATQVEAYAVLTDGYWVADAKGVMSRRTISDHYPVFARIRF